ncbi:hypothetical protein B0H17DRAFT_1138288 [Mycena rosella]|uniref:Uncharacterized protein n=1 Tax=Mycena rosella TaxID=1033263 RepID=A0AAD7G9U8_MYCRO|nr:hypothetical protein B0H17DRAFT_1138288 [Mycena rosella]
MNVPARMIRIFSRRFHRLAPQAITFAAFENSQDRDIIVLGFHNNGPIYTIRGKTGETASHWTVGAKTGDAAFNWRDGVFCLDDPTSGPTLFRVSDQIKVKTYEIDRKRIRKNGRLRKVHLGEHGSTIICGSDHGWCKSLAKMSDYPLSGDGHLPPLARIVTEPSDNQALLTALQAANPAHQRGAVRVPNSGEIKIGFTNDPPWRKGEWKRQCAPQQQVWRYYWEVPDAREFERLIHTHFKVAGAWIVPVPCQFCMKRHREKFDDALCGGLGGVVGVVLYYLGLLNWPGRLPRMPPRICVHVHVIAICGAWVGPRIDHHVDVGLGRFYLSASARVELGGAAFEDALSRAMHAETPATLRGILHAFFAACVAEKLPGGVQGGQLWVRV